MYTKYETSILGCCGLVGFRSVGNFVDKIDANYKKIPNSAEPWFKERLIKARYGDTKPHKNSISTHKFMCASVIISVADNEQGLANHLLSLGFTETKLGANRNTGRWISLFSISPDVFDKMFNEWSMEYYYPVKEEQEVKKKKPEKINPFIRIEPKRYVRDELGRFA